MPEFIHPLDVIKVLNEANVRVRAGRAPRTWRLDARSRERRKMWTLWSAARHHKKAVKRDAERRIPSLELDELPVVTRLPGIARAGKSSSM